MHSLWPSEPQHRSPGMTFMQNKLDEPVHPQSTYPSTYPFAVGPHPPFYFKPSAQTTMPASSYPRKRSRPLADIEGLEYDLRECSKKRRLRRNLVTSKLSAPYSVPSSHVMDRGNCSRVALLAKSRMSGRYVLRKAAILNKIKLDAMAAAMAAREAQERQVEIARQQFRDRLAAAAAAQPISRRTRAAAAQFHPPLSQGTYQLRPRKTKHAARNNRASVDEQKSDPYHTPMSRRPPSPPSEAELEDERRRRGLTG